MSDHEMRMEDWVQLVVGLVDHCALRLNQIQDQVAIISEQMEKIANPPVLLDYATPMVGPHSVNMTTGEWQERRAILEAEGKVRHDASKAEVDLLPIVPLPLIEVAEAVEGVVIRGKLPVKVGNEIKRVDRHLVDERVVMAYDLSVEMGVPAVLWESNDGVVRIVVDAEVRQALDRKLHPRG